MAQGPDPKRVPTPGGPAAGASPAVLARSRSFRRDFQSLDAIVSWVAEFFTAAGWAGIDPSEVDLIIEELFTNMVRYNPNGPPLVDLELRRLPHGIEVLLVDPAAPRFDVTAVPPVDADVYRAEKRSGGLGLHLVRQLADEFHYEHRDGASRITVRKNIEVERA